MKVLVTGHKGYIGAHLVRLLKEAGHQAIGCDLDLFAGCEWEPLTSPDQEIHADFRKLGVRDLDGFDAVMHLAAISNDPMGDLNKDITYAINREGSIQLARTAKEAGVPRFLFSSSCSIYGKGASLDLDEGAPLNPVSAYAESKIESERAIAALADQNFTPVYLRNATAYGYSPMLRVDLVVNNLLAAAYTLGEIRIMSDGAPWRPLIHCEDIARAFVAFLEAPADRVRNLAVNVGANAENYQVKTVADLVKRVLPDANIVYTGEIGADPRDYRVRFDLLKQTLPDFSLKHTLPTAIEQLLEKMKANRFSRTDFEGPRFVRLRTLKDRLRLLQEALTE